MGVTVPYHTLLFSEIERRLDSVLYRSCLVPSVYDARTHIYQGHVRVEGAIVRRDHPIDRSS